jgi:hypothetical protein
MDSLISLITAQLSFKMGSPGFEPGTNRLKAEYSTVELATQERFFIAPFTNVAKD